MERENTLFIKTDRVELVKVYPKETETRLSCIANTNGTDGLATQAATVSAIIMLNLF